MKLTSQSRIRLVKLVEKFCASYAAWRFVACSQETTNCSHAVPAESTPLCYMSSRYVLIPQPACRFSGGFFSTDFLTKIFVCIFNDSCARCLSHLILHDLIVWVIFMVTIQFSLSFHFQIFSSTKCLYIYDHTAIYFPIDFIICFMMLPTPQTLSSSSSITCELWIGNNLEGIIYSVMESVIPEYVCSFLWKPHKTCE